MGGPSDFSLPISPLDMKKRIISLGNGSLVSEAPKDSKVTFHFRTSLAKESDQVIIDDSKKMKSPMELILGKKFKLEIWEVMLRTMMDKEIAEFEIPKKYLFNYPAMSKTLRDNDAGTVAEHHCCGMLAQSCGYHDLDNLLTEPQDLTFTFEILNVERAGEYVQESWMLTLEEKESSIPSLKESGNKKFKEGNISEAKADYFLALSRIEQLSLSEKPGSMEFLSFQSIRAPLLLNYGLCLMKEGVYYEAIQHLSASIDISPDNPKGYFRLAKCHQELGNYSEALANYDKAAALDPLLQATVNQQRKIIASQKKDNDKADQVVYTKLFR